MNLPWEAIVTLFLAGIGFIVWLSTISVKLDILIKCVETMEKTIHLIEGGYVKKEDMAKDFGRLEQSVIKAHARIDEMQLNSK